MARLSARPNLPRPSRGRGHRQDRANRSKSTFLAASGTPCPSSLTSILQPASVRAPATCTAVPAGVCRIALSIRLSITRRSRSGSAQTAPEVGVSAQTAPRVDQRRAAIAPRFRERSRPHRRSRVPAAILPRPPAPASGAGRPSSPCARPLLQALPSLPKCLLNDLGITATADRRRPRSQFPVNRALSRPFSPNLPASPSPCIQ